VELRDRGNGVGLVHRRAREHGLSSRKSGAKGKLVEQHAPAGGEVDVLAHQPKWRRPLPPPPTISLPAGPHEQVSLSVARRRDVEPRERSQEPLAARAGWSLAMLVVALRAGDELEQLVRLAVRSEQVRVGGSPVQQLAKRFSVLGLELARLGCTRPRARRAASLAGRPFRALPRLSGGKPRAGLAGESGHQRRGSAGA
jgi:hypothetical protein